MELELLESRLTPSTFTYSGGFLSLATDGGVHHYRVWDADTSVMAQVDGNQVQAFSGPVNMAWLDISRDAAGTTLNYLTMAPAARPFKFVILADGAGQTLTADASAGLAANCGLILEALQYGGVLPSSATISLGSTGAGSFAYVAVSNYYGACHGTLNLTGTQAGLVWAYNSAWGEQAPGAMTITADVKLSGGMLFLQNYDYSYGTQATDVLDMEVTLQAGSTGSVAAYSYGRPGRDNPNTLNIFNLGAAVVDADIWTGAPGLNAHHTANVDVNYW